MDDKKRQDYDSQTDQANEETPHQTEQEETTEDEQYFSEISSTPNTDLEEDEEASE